MNKMTVRKIRPSDPGWGSIQAFSWPWLVLDSQERGRGFPTWDRALSYALKCVERSVGI